MSKILFVEDDPDQIFLYREVFALKGLTTIPAISGKEAREAIAKEKPDAVLLDIMLKEEDGLDIMEELKQNPETKNIPVIIFTNTNKKEYRDRAKKLGAADFIIKSQLIPQEVAERIKRILAK